MLAQAVAVVGHVDDERVVLQIELPQFVEHAPDAAVQILDRGVVGRDDASLVGVLEIAEDQRNLPGSSGPTRGTAKRAGSKRSRSSIGNRKASAAP